MESEIPGFLRNLTAAYQLRYHICLATKRKQPVFAEPSLRELVERTLADVCRRNGYHLLEHAVADNGLHLLLSLKPEHSVSSTVRSIKGNIWAAMKDAGRPAPLWSRGIFVRSVGTVTAEHVANYVASQFEHHGHQATAAWAPAGYEGDLSRLDSLRHSAHAAFEMNCHFVFVVARREMFFDTEMAPGVVACLKASAERQGVLVWRIEVVPDHTHILLGLEPAHVPATVAGRLMADAWRWLDENHRGALRFSRLDGVWKPSFYAGTAGAATTAQVRASLRRWGVGWS